jgi:hypothetical protein
VTAPVIELGHYQPSLPTAEGILLGIYKTVHVRCACGKTQWNLPVAADETCRQIAKDELRACECRAKQSAA